MYIHTYSWLVACCQWGCVCLPPFCREGEFFWGKEHCCLVQIKPEFKKIVCEWGYSGDSELWKTVDLNLFHLLVSLLSTSPFSFTSSSFSSLPQLALDWYAWTRRAEMLPRACVCWRTPQTTPKPIFIWRRTSPGCTSLAAVNPSNSDQWRCVRGARVRRTYYPEVHTNQVWLNFTWGRGKHWGVITVRVCFLKHQWRLSPFAGVQIRGGPLCRVMSSCVQELIMVWPSLPRCGVVEGRRLLPSNRNGRSGKSRRLRGGWRLPGKLVRSGQTTQTAPSWNGEELRQSIQRSSSKSEAPPTSCHATFQRISWSAI